MNEVFEVLTTLYCWILESLNKLNDLEKFTGFPEIANYCDLPPSFLPCQTQSFEMADGEWHTVSRTNPTTAQKFDSSSKKSNPHGRRSSHHQGHAQNWRQKPKSAAPNVNPRAGDHQGKNMSRSTDTTTLNATAPEFVPLAQRRENPFDLPEDDDNDNDDEEDDGSPDPIDLPLPPYHTTIIVSCHFDNCSAVTPFSDTTSLVQHIKSEHQLAFKNIHHMYMALEAYLHRWADIVKDRNLEDFGVRETMDGKGSFVGCDNHTYHCAVMLLLVTHLHCIQIFLLLTQSNAV